MFSSLYASEQDNVHPIIAELATTINAHGPSGVAKGGSTDTVFHAIADNGMDLRTSICIYT